MLHCGIGCISLPASELNIFLCVCYPFIFLPLKHSMFRSFAHLLICLFFVVELSLFPYIVWTLTLCCMGSLETFPHSVCLLWYVEVCYWDIIPLVYFCFSCLCFGNLTQKVNVPIHIFTFPLCFLLILSSSQVFYQSFEKMRSTFPHSVGCWLSIDHIFYYIENVPFVPNWDVYNEVTLNFIEDFLHLTEIVTWYLPFI